MAPATHTPFTDLQFQLNEIFHVLASISFLLFPASSSPLLQPFAVSSHVDTHSALTHYNSQKKTLMLERLRAEEKGTTDERLDGISDSIGVSLSKLGRLLKDREGWRAG